MLLSVKKLARGEEGTGSLQWRRLHRARRHVFPLLQMAGHGGTVSRRTAKNKLTDEPVLTATKALTKTTSCTFRAKKVEGHDKKIYPALCAGSVPPLSRRTSAPTFIFVPVPRVP